jgi:multiple sugar transport system substrate-binding protein
MSYHRPSTPPTAFGATSSALSRRNVLKGALLAGAALGLGPLAGCSSSGSGGDNKTITFGSNFSDAVPKKAMDEVFAAFEKKSGKTVKINAVDHNTFQEQINNYLQGQPDDVFSWFSGYRMQFFAAKGLSTPIDDVWKDVGGNYSDALKKASTGLDGKMYFVPFYNYPWAVFYRKSVFAQRGYTVPKTYDEFITLAAKMKADGIPMAFTDKDGWPAMGTFDYINMRTNGYDFHINLMAGKESWEDAKVKAVFDNWKRLLPHYAPGALGKTWQEGAASLLQKKAGMYVLGLFVGQTFEGADKEDLDFFAFPEIDPSIGIDAVEAPIDGFMLSKKVKNPEGAKELLKFFASAEAQNIYLKSDPNNIATSKDADTSGYNTLQKKAVELVGSAKSISQFLDRDTNPSFASTVMIPSIQTFLREPNNVDDLLKKIEAQKKSIFTS